MHPVVPCGRTLIIPDLRFYEGLEKENLYKAYVDKQQACCNDTPSSFEAAVSSERRYHNTFFYFKVC